MQPEFTPATAAAWADAVPAISAPEPESAPAAHARRRRVRGAVIGDGHDRTLGRRSRPSARRVSWYDSSRHAAYPRQIALDPDAGPPAGVSLWGPALRALLGEEPLELGARDHSACADLGAGEPACPEQVIDRPPRHTEQVRSVIDADGDAVGEGDRVVSARSATAVGVRVHVQDRTRALSR